MDRKPALSLVNSFPILARNRQEVIGIKLPSTVAGLDVHREHDRRCRVRGNRRRITYSWRDRGIARSAEGKPKKQMSATGSVRPYLPFGLPSNPENRYNSRQFGVHPGNPSSMGRTCLPALVRSFRAGGSCLSSNEAGTALIFMPVPGASGESWLDRV